MLRVERVTGLDRHLQKADAAVHRNDVADLIPGQLHVALLVLLNHLRAEASHRAESRIGVELVDPIAVFWKWFDAIDERVPPAVQRDADDRVVRRVRRPRRLERHWKVDQLGESGRQTATGFYRIWFRVRRE